MSPAAEFAMTCDEVCDALRLAPDAKPNHRRRLVRRLVEAGVLRPVGGTVDPITGRNRRPIDWTFATRDVLAYIHGETAAPVAADVSYLKAVNQ